MLEDGYSSELCSLKYWPFLICWVQIKATSQGQALHILMRALLSTAATATNAAPESRQSSHYTEVLK